MNNYGSKEFRSLMGDAMIRQINTFGLDEIVLGGEVRIAAFDEQGQLRELECGKICQVGRLCRSGYQVVAVDQLPQELHFAVRQIAEYVQTTIPKHFCFGANVRMRIRAGDMFSLRPLLERAFESGALTLTEAYCMMQPKVEAAWRHIVHHSKKESVWQQENALQELGSLAGLLEKQTQRIFEEHGLFPDSAMRIEGISMPLWIQE